MRKLFKYTLCKLGLHMTYESYNYFDGYSTDVICKNCDKHIDTIYH